MLTTRWGDRDEDRDGSTVFSGRGVPPGLPETAPDDPYIIYNDLPKISDLKRVFADLYRATPVLVNGTK
jgi:hypothetical protein